MVYHRCSSTLVIVCLIFVHSGFTKSSVEKNEEINSRAVSCELPQSLIDEIAGYAEVTEQIINYVTKGANKGKIWNNLAEFVDKFGPRFCGSQALEDSIDYLIDIFNQQALENIRTEEIEVPYWQRGQESVVLLQPRQKQLPMLGLGLSIATPPEGITAEAIVVRSFEELEALSDSAVDGKIVVYNQVFTVYQETGQYRMQGAARAAKKGAVAALVRSITPVSIASPHTGILRYEANITQIPAAAITLEDAEQLWRIQERGETILIKLTMPATLENRVSRNIYADLKGTLEKNLVVVAGHVDSWDVSEGAMDNGGGSFIAWTAIDILKNLNLRPKRTIRAMMLTAEEVGIDGFEIYLETHADEGEFINFAMNSDLGTFTPLGLTYSGSDTGECILKEVLKLFASINATEIYLTPESRMGKVSEDIPFAGLLNANDKYFWFHHTSADSMNVLDPDALDLSSAFWAAVSYVVADLSIDLPRN